MVELADGDLIRLYPYDAQEEVWSDDFMMGRAASNLPQSGILVEVGHYTVDFVEQHMPQIDVDRLRRIFRYRRPFWEEPPPR